MNRYRSEEIKFSNKLKIKLEKGGTADDLDIMTKS